MLSRDIELELIVCLR